MMDVVFSGIFLAILSLAAILKNWRVFNLSLLTYLSCKLFLLEYFTSAISLFILFVPLVLQSDSFVVSKSEGERLFSWSRLILDTIGSIFLVGLFYGVRAKGAFVASSVQSIDLNGEKLFLYISAFLFIFIFTNNTKERESDGG